MPMNMMTFTMVVALVFFIMAAAFPTSTTMMTPAAALVDVGMVAMEDNVPRDANGKPLGPAPLPLPSFRHVPGLVMAANYSDWNALLALSNTKNVMMKFYAPWCSNCASMSPFYKALAHKYRLHTDIIIAEMNVDNNQEILDSEDIKGLPTLKLYNKNGRFQHMGPRDVDTLNAFLVKYMAH